MQSTARMVIVQVRCEQKRQSPKQKPAWCHAGFVCRAETGSGFVLGFQNLATTVKTGRADVMAQVNFAGCGFHCGTGHIQRVV
jgi:hypothetical protein